MSDPIQLMAAVNGTVAPGWLTYFVHCAEETGTATGGLLMGQARPVDQISILPGARPMPLWKQGLHGQKNMPEHPSQRLSP